MPYNRPGLMHYATATKAVNHGAACEEGGVVGVAVKQKEPAFGTIDPTVRRLVNIGEDFAIITKGIVQVAAVGGAAKGTPIYITTATNALGTAGGAGTAKYGRVTELALQRGTPVGFMRVNLDMKDSF